MKTILGLDPGLAIIGYGLIEADKDSDRSILLRKGIIKTAASDCMFDRLAMIHQKTVTLVKELKPDAIAFEIPMLIGCSNASGVLQALGVMRLAIGEAGCDDPIGMTPSQMKKAVTGNGRADKLAVKIAIASAFDMPSTDGLDDVFDGIAVAYAASRGMSAAEAKGGTQRQPLKRRRTEQNKRIMQL